MTTIRMVDDDNQLLDLGIRKPFYYEGIFGSGTIGLKSKCTNSNNEIEFSAFINLYRALYKTKLFEIKDYLLTSKRVEYSDCPPGFIRQEWLFNAGLS